MKTYAILCSIVLTSGIAASANTWTLDSCINYAIEHNINIKSQRLNVKSAEQSVTEAKDRFLPELSAGASQSWSFGRGLTSENTYTNRNTSNFGWNVNMSLPLFQGLSAVRQKAYAKANLRTYIEELEAAKDDVTLNVISAYLQVLYNGEICKVAAEQLHLSEVEVERRKQLLEAGKIAELELVEARSQVAQDKLSLISAENDRTLALVDLAQLLELHVVEGFDISPIDDEGLGIVSPESVYERALNSNHSIVAGRLRVAAADRNVSLAASSYLPRLSFNAGLGSSYYTVNGFDNERFSTQMRNNFNKSIGFSLSVPIFDAFSSRNSVRRAKIERLNAQLQYEDAQRNLYKNVQQAYYRAVGADERLVAAKAAEDATHEAFKAMQEKYNFGRANATEFEQAKTAYIKAMAQSVQAKYESILRRRILAFYNNEPVGR